MPVALSSSGGSRPELSGEPAIVNVTVQVREAVSPLVLLDCVTPTVPIVSRPSRELCIASASSSTDSGSVVRPLNASVNRPLHVADPSRTIRCCSATP
eukprot:724434-Prymnesium_polylepis.1